MEPIIHYADWQGFTYFLEIIENRHPSGEATAWMVRYQITEQDGKTEVLPFKAISSDKGATTYDEAREMGAAEAKKAIARLKAHA